MIDFRSHPTALFGGSFDPVHDGHLHVAREVLKSLPELKQIVFIPAAQSPGKAGARASAAQRWQWLQLALEDARFRAWDWEIGRGGESFTVHTLDEAHRLGAVKKDLYWILGGDAYEHFPRWKGPEQIRALCRLIVVTRPGHPASSQNPDDILLSIPPHPASSSEIRQALGSGSSSSPWIPGPLRAEFEKLLPAQNPYVTKI